MNTKNLVAMAMVCGCVSGAAASVNRVTNGSFEQFSLSPGSPVNVEILGEDGIPRPGNILLDTRGVAIDGWAFEVTGDARMQLGLYDGAFPVIRPTGAGDRLLYGGRLAQGAGGTVRTRLSQVIDLGADQVFVDSGAAVFELSAWLGTFLFTGRVLDNDRTFVIADFLDAAGGELGEAMIAGPTDRSLFDAVPEGRNVSTFTSTTGLIPAGTRSVRLSVEFGGDRQFNNANADLIRFAVVPSPGVAFAPAALGLAALTRRSRVGGGVAARV